MNLTKHEKRLMKTKLITDEISKYEKGINQGKHKYEPTLKEVEEYKKELSDLKLKDLQTLKSQEQTIEKLTIVDKIKNISTKYSSKIVILMDNNTTDTFIINDAGRTFDRKGGTYLLRKQAGIKENKRTVYYYFQNNPFPIIFNKSEIPHGSVDAILLKKTLHFEYLQALANSLRTVKKIDMLLLLMILNFAVGIINLILRLKGG